MKFEHVINWLLSEREREIERIKNRYTYVVYELVYDERYNEIRVFSRHKDFINAVAKKYDSEVFYNDVDGYYTIVMSFHEVMKYIEPIQKLLDADLVLITISDFGYSKVYRAKFPYFRIWILKGKAVYTLDVEWSAYWDKRKNAYAMNVYGTNRVFELIYSIVFDTKLTDEIMSKVITLW